MSREGHGEASAGECVGWVSSRESTVSRTPTRCASRKAIWIVASPQVAGQSGVVRDPSKRRVQSALGLHRLTARWPRWGRIKAHRGADHSLQHQGASRHTAVGVQCQSALHPFGRVDGTYAFSNASRAISNGKSPSTTPQTRRSSTLT